MLNNQIAQPHSKMMALQKQTTDLRSKRILELIRELTIDGAKYDCSTHFAKAIARQLSKIENCNVSHTIIIRKNSPYRSDFEAAWKLLKVNGTEIKDAQYEKILMGNKIKELTEKVLVQDKIIKRLTEVRSEQDNKIVMLRRDSLPANELIKMVYEPFKELIDAICLPKGFLKLDVHQKQIREPLRNSVIFDKFPEGFVEWYLSEGYP